MRNEACPVKEIQSLARLMEKTRLTIVLVIFGATIRPAGGVFLPP
jgi:hypothetical protein